MEIGVRCGGEEVTDDARSGSPLRWSGVSSVFSRSRCPTRVPRIDDGWIVRFFGAYTESSTTLPPLPLEVRVSFRCQWIVALRYGSTEGVSRSPPRLPPRVWSPSPPCSWMKTSEGIVPPLARRSSDDTPPPLRRFTLVPSIQIVTFIVDGSETATPPT